MLVHPPAISLFKNASWGGLAASVRMVFGLSNMFLAIRLVGAEAYGYLALILAVTTFYVAVFGSVHTIAVTRAVECRGSSSAQVELLQLFSAVWLVTLIGVALLMLAAVTLGEDLVRAFVHRSDTSVALSDLFRLVLLVATQACLQLMVAGNVAVVEGLGRFDLAARAQMIGPPLTFLLFVFAFVWEDEVGILFVGGCYLSGVALELGAITILRVRSGYRRVLLINREAINHIPQLLRLGLALQAASMMNLFFDPFNKFMLNYFVGPAGVTTYEIATKIVTGIRGLFSGAFRVFLQLGDRLGNDGGKDYLKVLRYGVIPSILIHTIGGVLIVLLSRFWLGGEVKELQLFYLLLIPSSLAIIFVAPLYSALIGIGDIAFVFRLHLNLAVINLAASLAFIPLFGLLGAGIGLGLSTAYNALKLWKRYSVAIGPVVGLRQDIVQLGRRIVLALAITIVALSVEYLTVDDFEVFIFEGIIMALVALLLVLEPLTSRLVKSLIRLR